MAGLIVCKFGGTSVGSADRILNLRKIVRANERRRVIVVSAPDGITDMLTAWVTPRNMGYTPEKITDIHRQYESPGAIIAGVRRRFTDILEPLGLDIDINSMFEETEERLAGKIRDGAVSEWDYHYAICLGERVNGPIVAKVLDYEYVPACSFIALDSRGRWHEHMSRQLFGHEDLCIIAEEQGIVIDGFNGCLSHDRQKLVTFPRGGSNITGSVTANLFEAAVYENFTDVDGIYTADPKKITGARKICRATYEETQELGYHGMGAFHPSAIGPVKNAKPPIPIHLRSSLEPDVEGTWIVQKVEREHGSITGVTDVEGLSCIEIEKAGMNDEDDFDERLNDIRRQLGITFYHKPTSMDTMTVVVPTQQVIGKERQLKGMLRQKCQVDKVDVEHGFASICIVGGGMVHTLGVAAKAFTALANAGVNIRFISQGANEFSMVVGVSEEDRIRAVQAVHDAFFS